VLDPDGLLHTGDLGRLDADGYLYITGRAKDLIVLDSGKNVQPDEVEQAIASSDLVAEVCVLARQRSGGSLQVWAVIVPSAEARTQFPDGEELRRALAAALRECLRSTAPYKHPAGFTVHDGELPKTTTRKVLRDRVSSQLSNGGEALR
jgi:long-chain acyl-CoA synthetase